ncbi:uncharacterized protein LOC116924339 isoform X1 [Daphnia magna]|nr:uncharacterized protein LOC116924339 isoform X1 [Daphnia magna]XP_032786762.2 uncharacterized protein LOC116924339 isoform X1 [Daphnia magna]XP_032786763.2 uncharacterized protein LOC116924339 isoform X1 [Daphnia magna]XP_045030753.1 uncharacterized protein LOC116924339 isoform X1 [Daphnia magna]
MQRIQQRRRRLCHSTRRCLLFSAVVFILIGIHRHHEGVEGAEVATNHGCPVTQFRCSTTGRCVNLNVFCDGRNDCGDNSDEPAQCTHCNRTYYAGIGESYRLLVAWPKLNQMPFLCYLTFMSATQEPPQLLQVRVDTATIGQYVVQQSKDEVNGRCPEGCMQILEGEMQLNQPKVAPSALNNGGTTNTSSGGWPGAWCGASITPRFYYADSKSVTFALHLQTIPQSLLQKSKSLLIAGDTLSSSSITAQQLHPILDLTYKILPRSSAVLRYGGGGGGGKGSKGSNMNQLGEPVAGTACSRLFRQCGILSGTTANDNDQEECRVQSPGYPGIYPRNAHCLYRISSPRPGAASPASANAGRHVVALWQNDGRKINLRDWNQPTRDAGHSQRTSRSTAECEASGDYITIYDGVNTLAPVLARFCDGPLPQVVSSSADVTVEFRSSPLDTIYAGWTAIEGFELKVRIMAAENLQPVISSASEIGRSTITGTSSSSSSSNNNNNNNKCQWNVTSSGLSRGQLHSPAQTWPLRTMCHFRFVGRADERVWIYFAKYHFEKENSKRRQQQHQCRNALRIAEGDGSGWDPSTANSSAVGNGTIRLFCRDTRPPPLCERQLPVVANARGSDRSTTTPPPPCLTGESFLSNGSTLSVQQHLPEGTAFSPWKYVLVYEFFRPHQDGQPLLDVGGSERPINCNRLFSVGRNQSSDGGAVELRGSVKSPQNVFLFGRGGARHLKCVYRFQGDETMRVAIEVTRLRLGGHPGTRCRNRLDPLTHQRRCHMLRSTAIHSSPKDNKNKNKNKNNNNGSSSSTAFLQLRERPWAGQAAGHQILLQRDCLCDTSGLQLPFRYVSTSSAVEVVFNVNGMTHADDYHDFFFEISYEFLGGPAAAGSSAGSNSHLKCASQSELKPLQGPGGIIKLDGLRGSGLTTSRQNSVCNRQSWLLLPRADRFLFLSTTGFVMNNQLDDAARDKQEQDQEEKEEEKKEKEEEEEESYSSDSIDCSTKNRVVVYSAGQVGGEPLAIICPSARSNRRPDGGVKIFSPTFEDDLAGERQDLEDDDEWRLGTQSALSIGGVVIEFIAIQSGSYTLKWLELTPQSLLAVNPFNNKSFRAIPHLGSVSSSPPQQAPAWFFCSTWCPELKACIDSQLWCDGVYDCPSGVDESDQQCHSTGSSDSSDDDNNNNNMSPTDNEPPTRISAWNVPKVYWYLIAAGSTLLSLFIVVSSVLVCRENGHHHFKQPEVVAGLSSPANISQSSQGSFPPAPVTALNDYVYPPDNVVSGVANVKIVVGGTKTESVDKVSSLYHYDKKMAVS